MANHSDCTAVTNAPPVRDERLDLLDDLIYETRDMSGVLGHKDWGDSEPYGTAGNLCDDAIEMIAVVRHLLTMAKVSIGGDVLELRGMLPDMTYYDDGEWIASYPATMDGLKGLYANFDKDVKATGKTYVELGIHRDSIGKRCGLTCDIKDAVRNLMIGDGDGE